MKINNIEEAVAVIEKAGFEVDFWDRECHVYDLENDTCVANICDDDQLIEFAKKCQLKVFW